MDKITQDDIKLMLDQDRETLARWHNALNSWDWPEDLPDPESREETIRYLSNKQSNLSRRDGLMQWIENHIGKKYILRLWNKNMSDDKFDDFWRGCFEGDKEAYNRYIQKIMNR